MTATSRTTHPVNGDQGATQLSEFREFCARRAGRSLAGAAELHRFSIEQAPVFWRALLEWSELPWEGLDEPALVGDDVETARFFPGVRLNYAEALLRPLPGVDDDGAALTAVHTDGRVNRY